MRKTAVLKPGRWLFLFPLLFFAAFYSCERSFIDFVSGGSDAEQELIRDARDYFESNATDLRSLSFGEAVPENRAQQATEKVEVLSNGKTMVKQNKKIANQSNPSTLSTRSTETLSEGEIRALYDRMYLLNKDQELKKALKKVFPAEILDKCQMEEMSLFLRVNTDGQVFSVDFWVDVDSPLYNIDMQIYSDLEDIIKSTVRFNIPDKSLSSYTHWLPFILSRFTDEKPLFPPGAWRARVYNVD